MAILKCGAEKGVLLTLSNYLVRHKGVKYMNRTLSELRSSLIGFGFECRKGHESYVVLQVEDYKLSKELECPLVKGSIRVRVPEFEYLIVHVCRPHIVSIVPWVQEGGVVHKYPYIKWSSCNKPLYMQEFILLGHGRSEVEAWNHAIHRWFSELCIEDKQRALLRLDW